MREYQIKQLPIVLVPMILTLLALLVMTFLPNRHLHISTFAVLYWSVGIGVCWTSMAWGVFQVRVSRARTGAGREEQA